MRNHEPAEKVLAFQRAIRQSATLQGLTVPELQSALTLALAGVIGQYAPDEAGLERLVAEAQRQIDHYARLGRARRQRGGTRH